MKKDHIVATFMPFNLKKNPYLDLLSESLEKEGVEIINHDSRFNIIFLLRNLRKLDIIHFHWPSAYNDHENKIKRNIKFLNFCFTIVLSKMLRYKIFWTVHNLYPHDYKNMFRHKISRKILAMLADGLFIHFAAAEKAVKKEFGGRKFYKIKHGNYLNKYLPPVDKNLAREKLNLDKDAFYLMILGMLRSYKGVYKSACDFIEIAPPDYKLLIAGSEGDKEEMRLLKELADNNTDRIILRTEYIPDSDINIYFSAADIIWLSYRKIFTSGSLLLAFSQKKPVLAPKSPFFEEMVSEGSGILYDPESKESLKDAFMNLQNLDLEKASEKAYQISLSCDWKEIADTTKKAYEEA
ncbi:MAG: glycosyltransferase [Candidatus Coatesbacteria bacterium]|nr:glycosyltransferase [Candidatus Coatesbacteria bacterium]